MEVSLLRRSRVRNMLQTVVLVGALASLAGALGWSLGGVPGLVAASAAFVLLLLLGPRVSWRFELWLVHAQPLGRRASPGLFAVVDELSRRARLPSPPHLFYVPSDSVQAFTVGLPGDAAVALTDGILRSLSDRELVGVLAHELSHVRHRDMWLIALGDGIRRLTRLMATIGWIVLLFNLPLVIMGRAHVPWLTVALLLAAPTVSALLLLALSRAREYDADAGAVELTGDPKGLASALAKVEYMQTPWWKRILVPGGNAPEPSLFRTHPATEERIARLLALEAPHAMGFASSNLVEPRELPPRPEQYPRRSVVFLVVGPGLSRRRRPR